MLLLLLLLLLLRGERRRRGGPRRRARLCGLFRDPHKEEAPSVSLDLPPARVDRPGRVPHLHSPVRQPAEVALLDAPSRGPRGSKAIRLAPVAAASASSASPASRGRSPSVSNQHDERPSAHASSHALSWRTKAAKLLRPGEGAAGDGAREQPGEER